MTHAKPLGFIHRLIFWRRLKFRERYQIGDRVIVNGRWREITYDDVGWLVLCTVAYRRRFRTLD